MDGPGIRYALFTQGCPHKCKGCHNPGTHDPFGGYEISLAEIVESLKDNPLLDGITLTGGEPLLQAGELLPLAIEAQKLGLNVMLYSGYTFEKMLGNEDWCRLLSEVDILVDGLFEEDKRSLALLFRGSSNQRILDAKASLLEKKAVLRTALYEK